MRPRSRGRLADRRGARHVRRRERARARRAQCHLRRAASRGARRSAAAFLERDRHRRQHHAEGCRAMRWRNWPRKKRIPGTTSGMRAAATRSCGRPKRTDRRIPFADAAALHDWAVRQARAVEVARGWRLTPVRSASATTEGARGQAAAGAAMLGRSRAGPNIAAKCSSRIRSRRGPAYATLATLVQVFGEEARVRAAERPCIGT